VSIIIIIITIIIINYYKYFYKRKLFLVFIKILECNCFSSWLILVFWHLNVNGDTNWNISWWYKVWGFGIPINEWKYIPSGIYYKFDTRNTGFMKRGNFLNLVGRIVFCVLVYFQILFVRLPKTQACVCIISVKYFKIYLQIYVSQNSYLKWRIILIKSGLCKGLNIISFQKVKKKLIFQWYLTHCWSVPWQQVSCIHSFLYEMS
jgi:hypothetical protein